ncbi:MAG: hypothetical protein WC241_02695 [Candidatus Paceibacterota bacterium]
MDAEQLIIQFHELAYKRNDLKRVNSQLFCERTRKSKGSRSCIGELIERIRSEEDRMSETEFAERLSKHGCPICEQIWGNRCRIKQYSKQIGATKNKMHALAKRIDKKLA